MDNIKGADFADMQLISEFNKGIRFLLCFIGISSKYSWVIPLKDKKCITITNAFQKILDDSNHKPNKIWTCKGSKFYNKSMKLWLEKIDTEMYSTNNKRKSVFAERFIRTLKNKTYKYMTSTSKNVYIGELEDIANKYSNAYHEAIKMKLVNLKSNRYIDFSKKNNKESPKFKIDDNVKIRKYKNIFPTCYVPNWSEEVLVIKKVKNTVLWIYVISDLKGEEIVGKSYGKELQKANQKEFKVDKKKGDKLYDKQEGYDSSFNRWIDKKTIQISECLPEPKFSGGRVKVELDLSNYATKPDLENATDLDTSKFAKIVDLVNLKSDVDKLDIDKLKNVPTNLSNLKSKVDKIDVDKLVPVPVDSSKLSDVVKNDVVKKDVYNAKIKTIEDNIPDITNLTTNTTLDPNINEVENKIPNITNLTTTVALNANINEVKNKISTFYQFSYYCCSYCC